VSSGATYEGFNSPLHYMLEYSKELENKRTEFKNKLLTFIKERGVDNLTDGIIITCLGDEYLAEEWQELYFSTGEWVGDFKSFFIQNR